MFAIVGFLLAVLLVVSVHEWGHFYAARRLGVPVVRFSIGMGAALWSKKIAGVEYRLAWLPLGGYVLFADPKEHVVAESDRSKVFSERSLLVRAWIVFAGPAVNLLLAWLLMVVVLVVGIQSPKAWLAPGAVGTPWAAVSGQQTWQVNAINGHEITQFEQLPVALLNAVSSSETLVFSLQSWQGEQKQVAVSAQAWKDLAWKNPAEQMSLWGMKLAMPVLEAKLAAVERDSAAAKAGLQEGDVIKLVDGMVVDDFSVLSQWIKGHPNQAVVFTVLRNDQLLSLPVVIGVQMTPEGNEQGFLGVRPVMPDAVMANWLSRSKLSLLDASLAAPEKLWALTRLTLQAIGRLLTGQSGLEQISGPVGIAEAAGSSLEQGWIRFFQFLALLSLSLGVLNLLPLPLLDGGHLFLYALEAINGKAFSETFMLVWQKVGIVLIACLTLLAIGSDLKRLFGG
jgi:regulator of sigma E protease